MSSDSTPTPSTSTLPSSDPSLEEQTAPPPDPTTAEETTPRPPPTATAAHSDPRGGLVDDASLLVTENVDKPRLGKSNALKFLVSALYCGSVIGRGGSNITAFQDKSGAQILVSQNGDFFPNSNRERVVLVQSNDAPDIIQAITLIINCINEEHEGYTNRQGALTFKLVVPELSAGMLIGHGGDNIKKIYTDTGSKVKINLHKREIQGLHERVLSLTGKENNTFLTGTTC